MNHTCHLAIAFGLVTAVAACGGSNSNTPAQQPQQGQPQAYGAYPQQSGYPPPNGQYQQPQSGYPQQQPQQGSYYPQGQPAPGAPAGYPPPAGAPAPAPAPAAGGSVSGTAAPMDPNLASVATVPLNALATQDAPGMQPEGTVMAGQFQTGQTLQQPITIQPGKCYTFLAVGAGPQEVDISVIAATPIPGLSPVLGRDTSTGSKAVLGAKSNCLKLAITPFAVPANWIITATKGSGVIAAQAYSK